MPTRIPGDTDPDDRKWQAAREKEELEERATLKREAEEVRQEFDVYEVIEADYQERFARRVLSFPRRILKARSDNARE